MNKKTIILYLLVCCPLLQVSIGAAEVLLTISNTCNHPRQEVVEVSMNAVCQQLGCAPVEPIIVRNRLGQEMTYQKSYDGKLLLYTSLQPNGEVEYTISKGKPSAFKSYVFGRVYAERLDDLTWENDRGIYRIYGPALQQRGERSFGTDVWVKNTPDLVAEERYRLHLWGWHQEDPLNTSFHLDHGYGMDVYSVGASLGCGAPALVKNGQLLFPYCFRKCRILDNGPLRFTAELTYNTTEDGVTEHRLITLDKGAHYNKATVWYDGISQPTVLAAGVVLHDSENLVLDKHYVLYADPTDNPKVHQSQIYVGALFPHGVDETIRLEGPLNHAVGMIHQYGGQPYTYYFGSAWSNYDVRNFAVWQLLADEYVQNITTPLRVHLKTNH